MMQSVKRSHFVAMLACGLLALILLPQNIAAQDQKQILANFIKQVNGRWTLVRRVTPTGEEHAKPLQGMTIISLRLQQLKGGRVRAVGRISAKETGIIDTRMGTWVPRESANKPFSIKSSGTWECSVDPNDKSTIVVIDDSSVKGNYRPYIDGIRGKVEARYKIALNPASRAGDNTPTLELVNRVVRSEAINLKTGRQMDAAALASSGCSCGGLTVLGNEMSIKWTDGGQDTWRRVSNR